MGDQSFEYKFVEIGATFFGGRPKEDHKRIITEAGAEGWELVQVLIKERNLNGNSKGYELIFKRPTKGMSA